MFFELKKKYDEQIKELELEINELENKILENEFNLELIKNNITISETEKENISVKYSLLYDNSSFYNNDLINDSTDIKIDD